MNAIRFLPAARPRLQAGQLAWADMRRAAKSCSVATVLLIVAAGCGEVVQENKDLQMDRRQVDTYADEPQTEPEDHTLLEPLGDED